MELENSLKDCRVTPELKALRGLIWKKALRLSVELQYAKRYEKAHKQGQYDALKEIWNVFDFEHPKWLVEDSQWSEEKMVQSIDDYFDNVTEQQLLKDLEETGCSDMIEDTEDVKEGEKI